MKRSSTISLSTEYGINEDSDRFVHFVIIGMSKMGLAMGIEAMQQAHYLNFRKRRTRISFIDMEADREMAFFKGRYENIFGLTRHRFIDAESCGDNWDSGMIDPLAGDGSKWRHLCDGGENFMDTEIEFIKGAVESDGGQVLPETHICRQGFHTDRSRLPDADTYGRGGKPVHAA